MAEKASYEILSSLEDEDHHRRNEHGIRPFLTRWANTILLLIILGFSIGSFTRQVHSAPDTCAKPPPGGPKTGSRTELIVHHWDTPFGDNDTSVADKQWRSLFPPGDGFITMDKVEASAQNLPATLSNPQDESQALYLVAAFHELHCLTVVRASILQLLNNDTQLTVTHQHILHCLDGIRQSIMCNADPTPLWTEGANIYGDKQVHLCHNWNALFQWTTANSPE